MEPNLNPSKWQKDPDPSSNSFKPISLELGIVHMSRLGPQIYDPIAISDALSLQKSLCHTSDCSSVPIGWLLPLDSPEVRWLHLFGPDDIDCWLLAIRGLSFCSSWSQLTFSPHINCNIGSCNKLTLSSLRIHRIQGMDFALPISGYTHRDPMLGKVTMPIL